MAGDNSEKNTFSKVEKTVEKDDDIAVDKTLSKVVLLLIRCSGQFRRQIPYQKLKKLLKRTTTKT